MLSSTSEYALRALAELARMSKGEIMLGRDLATRTGIPAKYLSKIMLALRNAGIVAATRGAHGGYMLQRPADAIHLTDIIQVFEGDTVDSHCLLRHGANCDGEHCCTAHPYWSKVRNSFLEFLEQTTLIDIAMSTHQSQLTSTARKPVLN